MFTNTFIFVATLRDTTVIDITLISMKQSVKFPWHIPSLVKTCWQLGQFCHLLLSSLLQVAAVVVAGYQQCNEALETFHLFDVERANFKFKIKHYSWIFTKHWFKILSGDHFKWYKMLIKNMARQLVLVGPSINSKFENRWKRKYGLWS